MQSAGVLGRISNRRDDPWRLLRLAAVAVLAILPISVLNIGTRDAALAEEARLSAQLHEGVEPPPLPLDDMARRKLRALGY